MLVWRELPNSTKREPVVPDVLKGTIAIISDVVGALDK
jgi:hypothetical protein